MKLTGSRAYYRPSPPKMPPGLVQLMEGMTREVLKQNPTDVYAFCAGHMQQLLEVRDGPRRIKSFTLEERITKAQEVVRERAEKRRNEYDKNILLPKQSNDVGDGELSNNERNNVALVEKRPANKILVPVHHEQELVNSSEIEISHGSSILNETNEIPQNESITTSGTIKESGDIKETVSTGNNIEENKQDRVNNVNEVINQTNDTAIENLVSDNSLNGGNIHSNGAIDDAGQTKHEKKIDCSEHKDVIPEINTNTKNTFSSLTELENHNSTVNVTIDNVTDSNDLPINEKLNVVDESKNGKETEVKELGESVECFVKDGDAEKLLAELSVVDSKNYITDDHEIVPYMTQNIDDDHINSETSKKEEDQLTHDINVYNAINSNDSIETSAETDNLNLKASPEHKPNLQAVLLQNEKEIDGSIPTLVTDIQATEQKSATVQGISINSNGINSLQADIIEDNPTINISIPGDEEVTASNDIIPNHINELYMTSSSVNNKDREDSSSSNNNQITTKDPIHVDNTRDVTKNSVNGHIVTKNGNNDSNMDLETAAVTIQKVFRSFLFKSRASTEDSIDLENFLVEENDSKDESDFIVPSTMSIDRRPHGITRMDTVLQTVNEEKSLSLSTDDSSTLSSAATIIQAHVRGFLVRNKLNSNKTLSTNSFPISNSNDPSLTSLENDNDPQKNKTVLNIHIIPEGGDYLNRDESLITSMELSFDGSPPSSSNLHPLGYDRSERRKQLKREDAIQSISPPSNNSGKLSEDVDSLKELLLNDSVVAEAQQVEDSMIAHLNAEEDTVMTNEKNKPLEIGTVEPLASEQHTPSDEIKDEKVNSVSIVCMNNTVTPQFDSENVTLRATTLDTDNTKKPSIVSTMLTPSETIIKNPETPIINNIVTPPETEDMDKSNEIVKQTISAKETFENSAGFNQNVTTLEMPTDIEKAEKNIAIEPVDPTSAIGSELSETLAVGEKIVEAEFISKGNHAPTVAPVDVNITEKTVSSEEVILSEPTKPTTAELLSDTQNTNREEDIKEKRKSLTKMSSDESDVVTPFIAGEGSTDSKLLHSGEFHDVVLPTQVSRNDTSVVRGE